jgi:hypothetical protein
MRKLTGRYPLRPGFAFLVAVVFAVGGARAATFTVTSLADSGPGSLRQAVLDANASVGADDVVFGPGVTGTITLASGEIPITDSLFVHGPGAAALTVSGNFHSRIFDVESPAATPIDVTLSGLTLTQGSSGPFSFGGAVLANGENLTILDSVISNSSAGDLEDAGCGGNVAFAGAGGATLRIADSTLTGGNAVGSGVFPRGGNLCVVGGTLILERSTLAKGQAGSGGGLHLQALTGDSTISATTISGNESATLGGGIAVDGSSAGVVLTIDSSTISGNTTGLPSPSPATALGGGMYLGTADVRVVNSTISGNHAIGWGGGIVSGSSLLLRLTTVTGNTADRTGGSILVNGDPLAVELDHAIVANGTPEDLASRIVLSPNVPLTITANYSLVEAPGSLLLAGAHNLTGVDPLLGPLANNGGPTQTHLPLLGSPVIDAGDPAIPGPPPTDQRGFQRIIGPAVDLGAVEVGGGIAEMPTLSSLGIAALSALLLGAGVWRLRRPASGGP